MNLTDQSAASVLPDTARQRLDAMGVAVGVVDKDGRVAIVGRCRPVEQWVVTSPLFARLLLKDPSLLQERAGEPIALWPGVFVVPLPGERRRRAGAQAGPVAFAVLLTPAVLTSEQFLAVCQARQMDVKAAIRQVDAEALTREADVPRLAMAIGWLQQDAGESQRRLTDLQTMGRQLGESYEELSLLYKFSTNMLVNQPPSSLLKSACEELAQVVGLRWMVLQLTKDESRLNDLSGQLFLTGSPGCQLEDLRAMGRHLMSMQATSRKPLVVDDVASLNVQGLSQLGRNLLAVPLRSDSGTLGVIFGCDKLDGSALTSVDSKLCTSLAGSLSIFLENNMLYEDMQAMFLGTLHALTSAIDAKDSYTHGHSERVALMSRMLAEAAGLDTMTIERIYISGLIHDVGKIGVPEAVLSKPGKLTDEEFALIRMHPEIGARILQDIRQMQDLIPGVLYHHERWDGRGYPHGLAGEDIPLFGRLICLADSFDAMSSTRTYRRPIQADRVLAEIRRCAGSQFDPDLAALFTELDFEPFRELINKHQGGQSHHAPESGDEEAA